MSKKQPKKITQGKIIMALHSGAVLTCEHVNHPPSETKTIYRLSTMRRAIPSKLVQQMLTDGIIVPNGDGLFGDSQTYRLARGKEMEAVFV